MGRDLRKYDIYYLGILLFQSSDMRFILTWGANPNILDSMVQFYDENGNEICLVVYHSKTCGNYASLIMDDVTVIFEI